MAFNCSYRSLNENNIRHIYSDQKLRIIFPKRTHFRSLQEELPVPPLRLYPKRFYDYYPAYNIGLPRAPAFRGTDSRHVDQIVRRICQPMRRCEKERRHGGRNHRHHKDGDEEEEEGEEGEEGAQMQDSKDSPREEGSDSSRMTPRDMQALLSRLQRPTQSSERKKYNREERERERERETKESTIPKLPPISPRV